MQVKSKRVYAVLAIKDPSYGKSRLANFLSLSERVLLSSWFARRALRCCASVFNCREIVVISPWSGIRAVAQEAGMHALIETTIGNVNVTVSQATEYAMQAGAEAVLFVPTDLPFVDTTSIRSAKELLSRKGGCLIVPDVHGTGTNVLGVAPPYPALFQFGPGSFERHSRFAKDAGLTIHVHRDPALMFDVDTPDDFRQWTSMPGYNAVWRQSSEHTPELSDC